MQSVVLAFLLLCGSLQAGTFIIGGSAKGGGSMAASTTIYGGVWSGGTQLTASQATTESDVEMVMSEAGTFSKMQVYISANDRGASTVNFRKGTSWGGTMANGNQTIAINSSQTGRIDEATNGSYHTDHVNAGDVVTWQLNTGAGGATYSLRSWVILFTPDNPGHTFSKFGGYAATTFSSSNATFPQTLGGFPQNSSSKAENDVAFKFRTGGVWSHLCINIQSNLYAFGGSFKSRLNTGSGWVDGAQTASFAAGFTGNVCTTGSDTVADGTLACWSFFPSSSGTGPLVVSALSSELLTTDNTAMLIVQQSTAGSSIGTSATNYMSPNGESEANTTQGNYAIDMRTTMTLSNMSIYPISNSLGNNATAVLWKNNTTTSNLTKTIIAGASGAYVDDNTNSDTYNAGDLVEYKVTTSTGGTALVLGSLAIKATVPATTVTSFHHHGRIM